ncbi:MAG TPA: site-specific DNA-methyltransferase [Gemmatimonadota bacterium]|nr:site-specific DNA-methyltransferase [Gemmatimonadota bacterium]
MPWEADGTGRNRRTVWTITTQPFPGAHFATFPEDLVTPCVLAGSPLGGVVLDPFAGAGTVGVVCSKLGRDFIGIELKPEYAAMATERIAGAPLSLFAVEREPL